MGKHQQPKSPRGRVLVVDDDPAVRALLADFLEQAGFEVRATPDGPTALAAFHVDRFDVIFVDLRMPGMTGLEMAAVVRQTNPRIPIILVTGEAHLLEASAVAQAGIDRMLPKPFALHDLVACLRLTQAASPPAESLPASVPNHLSS